MEAVYGWIRQVTMFCTAAYVVLYLIEDEKKKRMLRFYLSLLLLLLLLKPLSAVFKLDTFFQEKLSALEIQAQTDALSSQLQEIRGRETDYLTAGLSEEVISWLKGLAQEENLQILKGTVSWDEEKLQKEQEAVIQKVELSLCSREKNRQPSRESLQNLKKKAAAALQLDSSQVILVPTTGNG